MRKQLEEARKKKEKLDKKLKKDAKKEAKKRKDSGVIEMEEMGDVEAHAHRRSVVRDHSDSQHDVMVSSQIEPGTSLDPSSMILISETQIEKQPPNPDYIDPIKEELDRKSSGESRTYNIVDIESGTGKEESKKLAADFKDQRRASDVNGDDMLKPCYTSDMSASSSSKSNRSENEDELLEDPMCTLMQTQESSASFVATSHISKKPT